MQANSTHASETCVSRSFLFVPGDSERKLAKAGDCGADALIVDLEDSVDAANRSIARQKVQSFLQQPIAADLWVRINPLDTEDALADLLAIMPSAPHGIVLPKPESAADVRRLSAHLDDLEREHDIEPGSTRILPIVTERPAALFKLHEYANETARLAGLTWGAEDLSAAVGASANRDTDGRWLPPYELARSLCLFAAAAAVVPAIDTVYTDFHDSDGLAKLANTARRDGFSGMLAIHPEQVAIINAAFAPSAAEVQRAESIVALFANNAGSGVLQLDGKMIDRPHYLQAQRILQAAGQAKK
jgi:citrate lyase subunit beta/citryl-CoA lyase